MSIDLTAHSDLDAIFAEVGEFGLYQIGLYMLLYIPNAMSATFVMNYMFTANTLDYRCKVPECDVDVNNRQIKYDQPWLPYVVPSTNGTYSNCKRFAPINVTEFGNNECSASYFDVNNEIECTEYVYASDEINLQTEFNIHCEDTYKLALIGTINSAGRFIFLPLTGFLSDKFGRLKTVIIGVLVSTIFGLIKSFSTSYLMYIILEFIEASAGTCSFGGMYILGMEMVSSRYRVLGSTLMATAFPIGEVLLGVAAMYIHNYHYLLRTLYTPGLLIVIYFWLLPESVRWLLVSGRIDQAIAILKRTASVNGKQLSKKSIEMLSLRYSSNYLNKRSSIDKENNIESPSIAQSLLSIMKSKTLCLRFITSCFIWVTCCYCYYGLSLISTHIPGSDRYTSFIIIAAVEIPGTFVALPLLNHTPRRKLLFFTLSLTGVCTIITPFIPADYSKITLMLFMVGKASITCAFVTTYTYTAEMWPTCIRTTAMNSCSMIGRIGAMVAPLTPLLAAHFASLPYLLFGMTAILAGILVLFMCETLNKKMPDTIDEAKAL